jgi:hypothetical protein
MTEYEDDDLELSAEEYADAFARAEIEELRDQLEEQQEVAAINAQIQELMTWHGSRFSPDEIDQLGQLIDAGHTPEEAYQAVAPETDETREYAAAIEQLERDEGRTLSEPEQDRVWQSVQDGTEEVDLHDLDTREGRRQWGAERLSETFLQREEPPGRSPPALT